MRRERHVPEDRSPQESVLDGPSAVGAEASGRTIVSWTLRVPRHMLGVLGVYLGTRLVILFTA